MQKLAKVKKNKHVQTAFCA